MWETVANHYGVKQESLGVRSQHTEKRSVAAWLAKRHTQATLRELAKPLVPDQDQNWGYSRFSFVRALEVVSWSSDSLQPNRGVGLAGRSTQMGHMNSLDQDTSLSA